MHTEEAFSRALGERDGERARLVVLLLGHTEDIGAHLGVRERRHGFGRFFASTLKSEGCEGRLA